MSSYLRFEKHTYSLCCKIAYIFFLP
uniref:Uncharacterized protein n=1 Tax=Arundo donax TaxID=35708 RepID=A0A0A9DM00_ARUDO